MQCTGETMGGRLRYKAKEIIKNKILDFEIEPGEVLRDGTNARKLGRLPVREPLLILEQEKLFEGISNMRYMVRKHGRKELKTVTHCVKPLKKLLSLLLWRGLFTRRLPSLTNKDKNTNMSKKINQGGYL
jgi:DNA-binding GntR family transcriptional regulator